MTKTAEEKAAEKAAKDQAKAEATIAKEAEKAAAEAAKAAEKAAASDDPITVKYRDHEGKPVERTFSKDVHGEGFATLAEEFKTTNASRLVTE